MTGHGIMYYFDGSSYDGLWAEGMREGPGTLKASNGDRYVGNFSKDQKQGWSLIKISVSILTI